jgi:hypothetical protein
MPGRWPDSSIKGVQYHPNPAFDEMDKELTTVFWLGCKREVFQKDFHILTVDQLNQLPRVSYPNQPINQLQGQWHTMDPYQIDIEA